MALNYSRQREAIKTCLMGRKDHPTADMVYMSIKQEYPNISLGTVYRNLQLLTDLGQTQKIKVGDGIDHYDGDVSPHYHFYCTKCHSVLDLEMDRVDMINDIASRNFDGQIQGHILCFTGLCGECAKAELS